MIYESFTSSLSHSDYREGDARRAFEKRGYRRYIIQCKYPISDINRRKRLCFTKSLDWTMEQWN